MYVCLYLCTYVTYLLQNGWTDLAKLFLLAPSWSRDGFRPKKILLFRACRDYSRVWSTSKASKRKIAKVFGSGLSPKSTAPLYFAQVAVY